MATKTILAGRPFTQVITFVEAKNVWTKLADFEVRAQLRADESTTARLIDNLHTYMTKAFNGDDIDITWIMTGAQTRALYAKQWGLDKSGYLSVILSDVGGEDVRSLVVPTIQIIGKDTTTTASGAL